MENQNRDCWKRLETVLARADMTINYFAKYIGLMRGENLYQIKRGRNRISFDVAQKIHCKFPEFSVPWLMFGLDGYSLVGCEQIPIHQVPLFRNLWRMPLPPGRKGNELFAISPAAANGAVFAAPYNGNPMLTPLYLRDTILLFREQQPAQISSPALCLIEYRKKRFLNYLERDAAGCLQMVSAVTDFQPPEVIDSEHIGSLWQVCATVKKW